jgi:hypothetical protein
MVMSTSLYRSLLLLVIVSLVSMATWTGSVETFSTQCCGRRLSLTTDEVLASLTVPTPWTWRRLVDQIHSVATNFPCSISIQMKGLHDCSHVPGGSVAPVRAASRTLAPECPGKESIDPTYEWSNSFPSTRDGKCHMKDNLSPNLHYLCYGRRWQRSMSYGTDKSSNAHHQVSV